MILHHDASRGTAHGAGGSIHGCWNPPVVVRTPVTFDVAAPVPRVWKALSDVCAWPTLDPRIREVSGNGPLASGGRYRWWDGRGQVAVRFLVVEHMDRLVWSEHGRWVRTLNWVGLDPQGAETRVTAAVGVDGPLRARPGVVAASWARLEDRLAGLRSEVEAASCR